MIEDNIGSKTDWIQFEHYFNAANQNFISRLRQQHPEITTGDIRLCCLLRMNISTKEISSLLNISVRAVELRRYRLRKRLELEGDTNLVEYLMGL
jgi:DNA-binding NarL/FixJ family response regulator